MAEDQRPVIEHRARVERACALVVVVERGCGARASWDGDREAAGWRESAEDELGEREAAFLTRVELLNNCVCVYIPS